MAAIVGPARADALQDEITHLIDFVRHSSCTFIRNGTEYNGPDAADHVQAKYDYYKADIKTAEDFIERAASKSMLSGKPYEVRCADGKTIPAADWIRTDQGAAREDDKGQQKYHPSGAHPHHPCARVGYETHTGASCLRNGKERTHHCLITHGHLQSDAD